ncbi:hypothetical protein D9758_010020 [Tetrapyrgos nigripes]|uniref:Protein kinase domain-containing protein n=1 Tax=Tetrapyrgos nigripes TaxID=182062 RepID=A0A8H5CVZ3_9AGAR|nr:hypothetical protein D9758_010020 [Tetrapyrgos nigripes]
MADPSSNAASFFPHSHGFNYINSNVYNVVGNMDVVHNHSDQGRGRLFSNISEVIPWSTESPRVVSQNNIELLDQLASRKHYYIHSGKYEQRFVLVKVFRGIEAKENFKEEKKQIQRLFHPSLLKMIGVSSFAAERPFIIYNFDILLLGYKIVSELANGLDYLAEEGAQARSNDNNSIEIFITDEDVLKIAPDFGSLQNSNTRCESGQIDEDSLWVLFNKLCVKTFREATYILHQDLRSRNKSYSIAEMSATDNQSFIPYNTSTSNFSERSAIYRRELLWRESEHGSRSVAAVARCYRQLWEHLNLTVGQSYPSYAMPRKQAARPLRIVVHRCQGYRKEEITLTSDISKNAIVSHSIPSLHEICPVCKEIVEEEEFRCACDGNDDGISPTIKSPNPRNPDEDANEGTGMPLSVSSRQKPYIAQNATPSPVNPLLLPNNGAKVCVECVMRDQDVADVDVTSPGIWDRENDVYYEDLRWKEEEQERSGIVDTEGLPRPRYKGGLLTEQNLKIWLSSNPREPASTRQQTLSEYVMAQRVLLEAESVARARAMQEARQLDDRMRDTFSQLWRSPYDMGSSAAPTDSSRDVRIKPPASPASPLIGGHERSQSRGITLKLPFWRMGMSMYGKRSARHANASARRRDERENLPVAL